MSPRIKALLWALAALLVAASCVHARPSVMDGLLTTPVSALARRLVEPVPLTCPNDLLPIWSGVPAAGTPVDGCASDLIASDYPASARLLVTGANGQCELVQTDIYPVIPPASGACPDVTLTYTASFCSVFTGSEPTTLRVNPVDGVLVSTLPPDSASATYSCIADAQPPATGLFTATAEDACHNPITPVSPSGGDWGKVPSACMYTASIRYSAADCVGHEGYADVSATLGLTEDAMAAPTATGPADAATCSVSSCAALDPATLETALTNCQWGGASGSLADYRDAFSASGPAYPGCVDIAGALITSGPAVTPISIPLPACSEGVAVDFGAVAVSGGNDCGSDSFSNVFKVKLCPQHDCSPAFRTQGYWAGPKNGFRDATICWSGTYLHFYDALGQEVNELSYCKGKNLYDCVQDKGGSDPYPKAAAQLAASAADMWCPVTFNGALLPSAASAPTAPTDESRNPLLSVAWVKGRKAPDCENVLSTCGRAGSESISFYDLYECAKATIDIDAQAVQGCLGAVLPGIELPANGGTCSSVPADYPNYPFFNPCA